MASLAFAVAGAALAPAGYASLGWTIGAALGNALFPGSLPAQQRVGPRLSDLKVQSSAYGQALPRVYGTARIAGNMHWSTGIDEHVTTTTESAGGKGGGPSQEVTTTTYSYSADFAVAICEGPIAGLRKIWMNGELVYNVDTDATLETLAASQELMGAIRVYLGTSDQAADPLIEADVGASACPAYRHTAYVVFDDLQLERFGNRIPNIEFEVVATGTATAESFALMGPEDTYSVCAGSITPDGLMLICFGTWSDSIRGRVALVDPFTMQLIREFDIDGLSPNKAEANAAGDMVIMMSGGFYWMPSGGALAKLERTDSPGTAITSQCDKIIVDGDGKFWFAGVWSSAVGEALILLDPADGTMIPIFGMPSGSSNVTALARADDGSFYLGTADTIYQVNDSGVQLASYTGISGSGPGHSMVVAGDGSLWTSGDGSALIYRYDAGLGARANISLPGIGAGTWSGDAAVRIGRDYSTGGVLVTSGNTLWRFEADGTYVSSTAGGTGAGGCSQIFTHPSFPKRIYAGKPVAAGANHRYVATLRPATIDATSVPLSEIVEDLCLLGGLSASDVDVTELTDDVDGYVVANRGPVRGMIEPLRQAYFFDAVESEGRIVFVKRGGSSLVTIAYDDLAARPAGDEMPEPLSVTRVQEVDLPNEVSVVYLERDADYDQGAQYARRLTRSSSQQITLQLPIVLSATTAKRIAETTLYEAWTERTQLAWSVSRDYAEYEPCDVVTPTGPAAAYTARITRRREVDGVIELEGVATDAAVYTQTASGAAAPTPVSTVSPTPATALVLLDMPIVRDRDDDAGFYAAAAGYTDGWRGAELYKSLDNGATYGRTQHFFTGASVIGSAVTALANFDGGNVFDELSTVDVAVIGDATLSSATEAQVLAGSNAAVLGSPSAGWEIFQFKTATLVATGRYRLTGLLRGRRGTEQYIATHQIGETFVLLSDSTMIRVAAGTAEIDVERLYKAPAFGSSIARAGAQAFTSSAAGLKPLSPVQLGGGRDASGNITITWVRRTRVGGEWRDLVDASLGEDAQAYEVEIWDSTYTTLKRTITGLSSATATYTEAQQISDWGSPGPQSTIYVRVYQVSATVGRGYKLQGTV